MIEIYKSPDNKVRPGDVFKLRPVFKRLGAPISEITAARHTYRQHRMVTRACSSFPPSGRGLLGRGRNDSDELG
jgi:hypothetical protein